MASMLEVLREFKHLTSQKRREGSLPDALEARLTELEALVRAEKERKRQQQTPAPAPASRARASRAASTAGVRGAAAPPAGAARPTPNSTPKTKPKSKTKSRPKKKKATTADLPTADVPTDAKPRLSERVAKDPRRRQQIGWAIVVLCLVLSPISALGFGVSFDMIISSLLPGMTLIAVVGWGLLYPGLMWWRERAARGSSTHLNEPDFVAKAPFVAPVIAALTGLSGVSWLILGDYADEGLARTAGYLFGMGFGLIGAAVAAILVVRPIARRRAEERAYDQYLEAGTFNANKNNARRARRLFERALEVAKTQEQQDAARNKMEAAADREAKDLEQRGYRERAKELRRTTREQSVAKPPPGTTPAVTRTRSAPSAERTAPPRVATKPRLLTVAQLDILPASQVPEDSADNLPIRQEAQALERRGKYREALEMLIDAKLTITSGLAKEAATEYIGASLIRSADAIYQAMGERQIPEFYKAVAVEWSRADEGFPPAEAERLASILWELGDGEAAVRVASQAALADGPMDAARISVAEVAERICSAMEMAPPPEIVERLDRPAEAAELYTRAGRPDEALRCNRVAADRMLENGGAADRLVPVLSRIFAADKFVEDKYLGPLVEHVVKTSATGSVAVRILSVHRQRHRGDQRVSARLFELYLDAGKLDDALEELKHLESLEGSKPTEILKAYKSLRGQFPDDTRVASGLAQALVRTGKGADATRVVRDLLGGPTRNRDAPGLIKLIDGLFEWGRSDVELRKERAFLHLAIDDTSTALQDLEQYVTEGGRNPEALDKAVELMSTKLVSAGGGPDYDVHMRLARFRLFSGTPGEALAFLEVARASDSHREEAELLLGRAELAASNPRRAVQVLRDAIDGRHPQDVPELHFELARAHEMLGDLAQSKKIDSALEHFLPDFVEGYLKARPAFDRADTIWMPTQPPEDVHAIEGPDTDVGRPVVEMPSLPEFGGFDDEATQHALDLADVLEPRYRLLKRVGSGGMGDVHLAEDLALGREVAIKVLRRSLATDLFIAKFKEEARIVAQLSHPGIVGVYDIGQRGEWSYIVMEYVAGPNLSTLVHATMPPTRDEILEIVAQVAEAMDYAHQRGVIHRDLKPANILVAQDGTAKVTDFGIARVLQGQSEETAFSAAGLQVGTVNYMAPEQIKGKPVNNRTDIYLLGTTLYYSLCLEYPYVGEAIVVQKVRDDPIPLTERVPDVSSALNACVARCMAREPTDRFETMRDLASAIRSLPDIHATGDLTELV